MHQFFCFDVLNADGHYFLEFWLLGVVFFRLLEYSRVGILDEYAGRFCDWRGRFDSGMWYATKCASGMFLFFSKTYHLKVISRERKLVEM